MDDKDLTQGAHVKPPSGSYTLWENTMCNPLGDMRTQTQNAWHDGYASAKVEREWVGLTEEEIAEVFGDYMDSLDNGEEDDNWGYERLLEAAIKEKNK
jgi:hypothetical protein